jgi:mRNA interferase RelE/StbE
MAAYKIELGRSARKDLQRLRDPLLARVSRAIDELALNPRPAGVRKLRDSEADWRIRVGEHRVVFEINDTTTTVTIHYIRHRRTAYRKR